jgi:DHA3 family macrolide efflux protein-like MFS transporter
MVNLLDARRKLFVFGLVWFGQLVSLVGSGLTSFALGVWVYQNTGSVTQFALISFFTTLPGIALLPLAGALVDRWDRRWAMILSDSGAGLCTLTIAILLAVGQLQVWHIYILSAVSSTFSAFQWPAYSAAITLLVPKEQLGRASGMVQFGQAGAQVVSPLLAGLLVTKIQIQGVILIDFATFLFAVFTLLLVSIPRPPATAEGKAGKGSLLREAAYGWVYVRERFGLLGLLLLFAALNLSIAAATVLLTPLVLGFADASVLGSVLSVAGGGMLAGGLVMSAWGGPKRRMQGVLGGALFGGLMLVLMGLRPNAFLIAVAAFWFPFCTQVIVGCSQAIWQSKVAPDVQGRVFAIRRMVAWSSAPLAYLVAGPLVDDFFGPLLAAEGPLAGSVGQIIGVGASRGNGLLLIVLGLFVVLMTIGAYLRPRLRLVEDDLEDAITE